VISPETRMTGLPYGEEIMIVGRTVWTQSTSVTDGQTDRPTDGITITKTVQRIASHGNDDDDNNNKTYCNAGNESHHVMISYQWDSQELALKIRDKLEEAKYKVWIDVDDMCTYQQSCISQC